MSDAQITPADYADIQGVVLNGYGSLKCTRFLFLQIGDAAAARRWLGELRPQITTGARRPKDDPKPETALNVAFTHPGLQMLGLPLDALAQFPREFQEGMADGERSRVLGDTGDSDPAHWDLGGPTTPVFHALLMLYGRSDDVILARTPILEAQFTAAGLTEVFRQDTGRISNREPFGFADGISQPFPAGSPGSPIPGEVPINAGEFLLGYRNGYGKPRTLTLSSGTITVRRPRVRGLAERFESRVLPLFQRHTEQVGDLLPELYLHGLSSGDFDLALRGLLGEAAPLSASSLDRPKAVWQAE